MQQFVILGVRARLPTSNPNFSKAKIRTDIWIYRFNNCWCDDVSMRQYTQTHQLIEEMNSTIPTLPTFPPKKEYQRSWGSKLTIQSEQFFSSLWKDKKTCESRYQRDVNPRPPSPQSRVLSLRYLRSARACSVSDRYLYSSRMIRIVTGWKAGGRKSVRRSRLSKRSGLGEKAWESSSTRRLVCLTTN